MSCHSLINTNRIFVNCWLTPVWFLGLNWCFRFFLKVFCVCFKLMVFAGAVLITIIVFHHQWLIIFCCLSFYYCTLSVFHFFFLDFCHQVVYYSKFCYTLYNYCITKIHATFIVKCDLIIVNINPKCYLLYIAWD